MKKVGTLFIMCILYLTIIIIIIPKGTCSAGGVTIDVYEGNSIQEAINLANNSGGDTVYIHSGIYKISSTLIIDRPVNLLGESSSTVTIMNSNGHTIKVTSNDVSITDLTIKNSGKKYQCIWLDYISNCIISYNSIEDGAGGINLVSSNSNTIENNYFNNNYNGIWSLDSDLNTIKSNIFQNSELYGVSLDSSSNGNYVYLNDFNDMVDGGFSNACDDGSNNWNLGSQGNYWDDYNDYDSNNDNIGDNPYSVSGLGKNKDEYPLGDFLTKSHTPVAYIDSISPNPSTEGEIVSFIGHGTDDGTIIEWEWKSSIDGILENSKNYQSSTLSIGSHNISYRVRDNEAHWSKCVYEILIINAENDKPDAYILEPTNSITRKFGESIRFVGDASDDGQIVEYYWSSSIDGYLSNAIQFTKNDLSEGQHTIYLKVRDDKDEWSSEYSIEVIILSETSNNPPIADSGGPYFGVKNQTVTFDASESYDPDNGDSITTYQWDFGDGSTGEGVSTQHIYTLEGNYTVELTVTDSNGEQKVVNTYINVSSQASSQDEINDDNKDTPGFETIFMITAIIILLIYRRKKRI